MEEQERKNEIMRLANEILQLHKKLARRKIAKLSRRVNILRRITVLNERIKELKNVE